MALQIVHMPRRDQTAHPRASAATAPLLAKAERLAALGADLRWLEMLADHAIRTKTDPAFKAEMDAKWNGTWRWGRDDRA